MRRAKNRKKGSCSVWIDAEALRRPETVEARKGESDGALGPEQQGHADEDSASN